jgi:hypothetical protein
MAEEPAPEFTYALADEPEPKTLAPMYALVMAGKRPAVSLGAVTRAEAVTWLQAQHDRYSEAVGNRSGLLKGMKLENRVTLVGVSE